MAIRTLLDRVRTAVERTLYLWQKTPGRIASLGFFLAVVIFLKTIYLWAPQYDMAWQINNLQILVVDYDRGLLSRQLYDTYHALKGPTFPGFTFVTDDEFRTEHDIQRAVTNQAYWGAMYIRPNASSSIQETLKETTESVRNSGDDSILVYVWNEANYPMVADWVRSALRQASENVQRDFVWSPAITNALSSRQNVSVGEVQTKLRAVSDLLQAYEKTCCAGKALGQAAFNHLGIITLVISTDVFLRLFQRSIVWKSGLRGSKAFQLCYMAGVFYSACLSLALISSLWLMKGKTTSQLDSRDYFLSWIVLWACSLVLFSVSCTIRVWSTPSASTQALSLFWMAVNAASAFVPVEVSPPFFQLNWALPGHAIYRLLVAVWCGGGTWQAAIGIPVLVCWCLFGAIASWIGLKYCAHDQKTQGGWSRSPGSSKAESVAPLWVPSAVPKSPCPSQATEDNIGIRQIS